MRTNPDPTLPELEESARLAAERLAAAKAALAMEQENFKSIIEMANESRGKIKELSESLNGLTIDKEDAEADAAWHQKRSRKIS